MRPPTTTRRTPSRANTATPVFGAHKSPAGSVAASRAGSPARSVQGGGKRKEREFENEEETNINVVVRCRGRNDREVRENSGVVVSTEGVKGKKVELSMGPSALSNKTYVFDRVFSPAADQAMIFEGVVEPILDEVSANIDMISKRLLIRTIGALRLQLHHFRVRSNRYWKNVYHVR